jgi:LysR family transcriptional regulator for metE and metH
MIDRQHLTILREIARQGGVTAAADRLCLTQSALSHAVRRLEEQLGAPLWRREGRRLTPTPAGAFLLEMADRLLPQFELGEARLSALIEGRGGMLRIGMECHPCYNWLQRVIGPFLAAFPDIDLDVRQAFQFGGVGPLIDHEIDALITPDPVETPGLRFIPVFDYEMRLAVARSHRLAGRAEARPEDLSDETLITYPVPTERLDIYTGFLLPARRAPKVRKIIETTDVMVQMVAAGRGVTALPDWMIAENAPTLGLHALRIGPAGLRKSIHVGVRDEDADLASIRGFLRIARDAGAAIETPA